MTPEITRNAMGLLIILGWLAISIMVFVRAPEQTEVVVGGWIGIAGAAVREFFGAPGAHK